MILEGDERLADDDDDNVAAAKLFALGICVSARGFMSRRLVFPASIWHLPFVMNHA
jgi:hypothetical protein